MVIEQAMATPRGREGALVYLRSFVDEMKASERVERLFGADLIKEGILPVNVVVSNFGKQRLLLKPSDIML